MRFNSVARRSEIELLIARQDEAGRSTGARSRNTENIVPPRRAMSVYPFAME